MPNPQAMSMNQVVARVAQEIRERRRFFAQKPDKTQPVVGPTAKVAVQDVTKPNSMRRPKKSQIPILAVRGVPPNFNKSNVVVAEKVKSADVTQSEPMDVGEVQVQAQVEDIDRNDGINRLLCPDYVKNIYAYLFELEKNYCIRADYMENYEVLTPHMRSILIEWLVQVHMRFNFVQETLFMATGIVDLYLQLVEVDKTEVQLVGVTALYISAKFEEICIFDVNQASYVTGFAYTRDVILAMEKKILRKLNFTFARPLQITFLRRFSKAANASRMMHELAKYFMELMLLDMQMADVMPSVQAATAIRLSMLVLRGEDWSDKMAFYTNTNIYQLDEATWKFVCFYHNTQPMKSASGQLANLVCHKYADDNRGAVSQMSAVDLVLNIMYKHISAP